MKEQSTPKPVDKQAVPMINPLFFIFVFILPGYFIYNTLNGRLLEFNEKTILFSVIYTIISIFAVSVGYHRFYAHHSYKTIDLFKVFILLFGSASLQGSVHQWVVVHKSHHKFRPENDPYSFKRAFLYAFGNWQSTAIVEEARLAQSGKIQHLPPYSLIDRMYIPLAFLMAYIVPTYVAYLGWNDLRGGLFIGGILRAFITQLYFYVWYQMHHGSFELISMEIHHKYTEDYHTGLRWYCDINGIILRLFSILGLTRHFQTITDQQRLRTIADFKQKLIDIKKAKIDFGPKLETLPLLSWEDIKKQVSEGKKLIVIDNLVHDIAHFEHPGGAIILTRVGKDATGDFNGGVYCHSKAARNLAVMKRVGKLKV